MRPLDPRLLKYAKSARGFIIEIAVLGFFTAALVIAQAFLISGSLSPVVSQSASLSQVLPTIGWLALVVVARALLVFAREARAHRAADRVTAQLRTQVLKKAVQLGPRWRARNAAENTTLVTRGLQDLEPYFVKFLPQLLLVVTVTPLALAAILILDFWSALIALLTIPLIPIFMVLIGRMTQGFSSKKLVAMERLGAQLLDLLTGLPTLRALGREKGPREHLIRLGRQNTRTTMQTLRVAFLSGGVLEFLSTLSVALVAVQVGMRMVNGQLSLYVGLIIIMLAPEVFEPLRQVGAQFHASANGVAAAEQCFVILETPSREEGVLPAAPAGTSTICFRELSVAARGAWAPARLNGSVEPGKLTVLVGPSGSGKSTAVQVLLGLEPATRGAVTAMAADGSTVPVDRLLPQSWWEGINWIPQHPTIEPGTILANVDPVHEGGHAWAQSPQQAQTPQQVSPPQRDADVPSSAVLAAARATGFDRVVDTLPDGWDTLVGTSGVGLSVGQRQRLALTRALATPPSLLVLDEPTAHLDALSEEQVVNALRHLRDSGTTLLVIAHRQAVVDAADCVLEVHSQRATTAEEAEFPQLSDDFELEDLGGSLPGFLDPAYLPEDDDAGMTLIAEQARQGDQNGGEGR